MESVDDNKEEVTAAVETPNNNRLIRLLETIKFNIREGQKVKGKLTLQDCRVLFKAEKTLLEFFERLAAADSKDEEESKVYATEEIYAAYRVLLASLEVIQSTGIFSIEGASELLDWMEELASGIDAVKDPAIRIRELKEKTKQSSKEKKGSKKK